MKENLSTTRNIDGFPDDFDRAAVVAFVISNLSRG
jgi:hypothetical protein